VSSRSGRGTSWAPRDLRALAALIDRVLRPFLAAADEAARVAALERILEEVARPAIARVLRQCRRALEAAAGPAAAEDIESAVLLRVVQKLEASRGSEDDAVARLDEYVARLTFHAVADVRRQSAPEWARLKRRLRYVAGSDARLATWDLPSMAVCGLAAWRDRVDVRTTLPVDADSAPESLRDPRRTADALVELLARAGRALPLDAVTELFDALWSVEHAEAEPEDEGASPVAAYETREELQLVWEEICALPVNQRAALLLNLRDEAGRNAVVLFPLTGVASFDEIAAAIEMSSDELIAIWPRLPLADLDIAQTLGLERQQVINLRKSARARLQRRIVARQKRSGR
jgi:hypothetical protein